MDRPHHTVLEPPEYKQGFWGGGERMHSGVVGSAETLAAGNADIRVPNPSVCLPQELVGMVAGVLHDPVVHLVATCRTRLGYHLRIVYTQ